MSTIDTEEELESLKIINISRTSPESQIGVENAISYQTSTVFIDCDKIFIFFILLFFRSVSFKTTTGIVRRITDFVYFYIRIFIVHVFFRRTLCMSLMV